MKVKKHRYGYKVGYLENGNRFFNCHFKTYTYKDAKTCIAGYIRYPPRDRADNHILIKPKWIIIPITKQEVKDGIWREVPF